VEDFFLYFHLELHPKTSIIKKFDLNVMTNNGEDASKFANVAFSEVFKFGTQSMLSDEEVLYK
jgi:hypothetical protein